MLSDDLLTDKQKELRDASASEATHILCYGGARGGKTFEFCREVAARALMAPGSRHLIGRHHNIDVRQSIMLDTWPKMMRLIFPQVSYRTLKSPDQVCYMPDGSEVWFGGLDENERVEKILGKEYATIYLVEVSQIAYETVGMVRTRLAQQAFKRDGTPLALKAYYDLNPVGRSHWTRREFVEKLRPDTLLPLADPASRAVVVINPVDNPHLPAQTLAELEGLSTRLRERFYLGQYLSEVPGALWNLDQLDRMRVVDPPCEIGRIVIGVDPSGTDGISTAGDRQGIVVVGMGMDGVAYVLEDISCHKGPEGWARDVAHAYLSWRADLVVAEINYGGAMVEAVLRTAQKNLPVKVITSSRGKHLRAEPVSALYTQGKVRHVGTFRELEDQMTMTTSGGYQGTDSPDRMDALVFALTELMVDARKPLVSVTDDILRRSKQRVAMGGVR